VPLVLVPLAFVLVWVAIWRIWLPPAGGGGLVARTVTRVDANASTRPTHRVTTVVRTSRGASPSRRSEALALALVFLGAGAAVIGLFHNRLGSIELDHTGIKIELTPEQQTGAAALVGRLAAAGAPARTYARGFERYLRTLSSRQSSAVRSARPGGDDAVALADRIADDLV
jgi:hypothetical protein